MHKYSIVDQSGVLEQGANRTISVYVRNEGNAATTLYHTMQNWYPPAASNYMTLNWDHAGQTISANQVLQVKLTLTVSSTIFEIKGFSFDITITATGSKQSADSFFLDAAPR